MVRCMLDKAASLSQRRVRPMIGSPSGWTSCGGMTGIRKDSACNGKRQ